MDAGIRNDFHPFGRPFIEERETRPIATLVMLIRIFLWGCLAFRLMHVVSFLMLLATQIPVI